MMGAPVRSAFIYLMNLAWKSRLHIPFLLTVCFLVFDIRLQLEVNVNMTRRRNNQRLGIEPNNDGIADRNYQNINENNEEGDEDENDDDDNSIDYDNIDDDDDDFENYSFESGYSHNNEEIGIVVNDGNRDENDSNVDADKLFLVENLYTSNSNNAL